MKPKHLMAVAAVLAVGLTRADWNLGDPHKMHFPQLPDPLGWDVAVITPAPPPPAAVADDWRCTKTGPVSDIHIWFSVKGDAAVLPGLVAFSIWSDVPAQPGMFSHPGQMLWSGIFGPGQYTVRRWADGLQGWYDPNYQEIHPRDHAQIWQLNLTQIDNPFVQIEGNTYWLGVNFAPDWTAPVGWKTSVDHWNDDAVWWNWHSEGWEELRDPITGGSLDMAFVITPEPSILWGSALLVGFALWHRWTRRARGH